MELQRKGSANVALPLLFDTAFIRLDLLNGLEGFQLSPPLL